MIDGLLETWTLTFLLPLAIAVPLLVAALMVTVASLLPRIARDAIMLATTLFSVAVAALLLVRSADGSAIVVWLGGFAARGGTEPGIALYADAPASIVLVAIGLVFVAVTTYAWKYFKVLEAYFHVMLLVLLAAMTSLVLAADIFTMFVSFELMSVIAYALVAYKVEDEDALAGAFNFAILGTVASLLMMTGIAFLYARTGTLNLAAMGRVLIDSDVPLAALGIAMVMGGLLLKMAVVPLHFWIADAEAVAPSPVATLSSAAMALAAAFWIARLFGAAVLGMPSGISQAFSSLFLTLGVASVWLGAILCVFQTNLKRLLAFSTVSHMSVALIGLGIGGEAALAGTGLYIIAQSLVKAALFLLAGAVSHRFGTTEIIALKSRVDGSRWLALPIVLGGLALAGLPPFGLWAGKVLIEEALPTGLFGHVLFATLIGSAILTGGAVINAVLYAFFAIGPSPIGPSIAIFDGRRDDSAQLDREEGSKANRGGAAAEEDEGSVEHDDGGSETEVEIPDRVPPTLFLPPIGLLVASVLVALWPQAVGQAHRFASILLDGKAFHDAILDGHTKAFAITDEPLPHVFLSIVVALSTLLVPLCWWLASKLAVPRFLTAPISGLRGLHDGLLNDYLVWLVGGFTLLMGWMLILA